MNAHFFWLSHNSFITKKVTVLFAPYSITGRQMATHIDVLLVVRLTNYTDSITEAVFLLQ